MTPEMLQVAFAVFTVWGALVAWKALKALRTREEYQFRMWDGGMLRAGKRLNRTGTIVKLGTALLIVTGCVLGLTGNFAIGNGYVVFVVLIIAGVVSDFINSTN